MKSIQIQSATFGDYLGIITVDGTFQIAKDPPQKDDALDSPEFHDPSPASEDDSVNCCKDCDSKCYEAFLLTGKCPPDQNTKPTEKPASNRQLLIANLNESSLMLELKWSDQATKIVKLKNVGEMDEDCFYSGSYVEDPQR